MSFKQKYKSNYLFFKKNPAFSFSDRFFFVTSVGQASKNYKPTWAVTIATEKILPLHRSHLPLWTFLATKWRILGNARAEKFGEKNCFCMLDLFHVLLKPKIIKHLQFHHQAFCCVVYPHLKAMAVLARKLNTAEGTQWQKEFPRVPACCSTGTDNI